MFLFTTVKFLCSKFKSNVPREITLRSGCLSGHSTSSMSLHSNSKMNFNGSLDYAHSAQREHKNSY